MRVACYIQPILHTATSAFELVPFAHQPKLQTRRSARDIPPLFGHGFLPGQAYKKEGVHRRREKMSLQRASAQRVWNRLRDNGKARLLLSAFTLVECQAKKHRLKRGCLAWLGLSILSALALPAVCWQNLGFSAQPLT
ncbi:unnamed protein product [Polarella glacialis]|uniref:Uncharacterized protein n=1 Tax=Polarella glacialis TaxID=89957 RepID=A0A813E059_POLGL|nr:unnamed protein product [Polarella glacialis]